MSAPYPVFLVQHALRRLLVAPVRREPPFCRAAFFYFTAFANLIQSLCQITSRAGWRVVQNVAVFQDEGRIWLHSFDECSASVLRRNVATIERSIDPRVVVQADHTTDSRNLSASDHCERIHSAMNELVIASECIEEQIISTGVVLNGCIPNRDVEAARSHRSA